MLAMLSSGSGRRKGRGKTQVTPLTAEGAEKEERDHPEQQPATPETLTGAKVAWQWEHRKGWRNYPPHVNKRIEASYQAGKYFIRVKSGKTGTVPMEIFFNDFLQYDPVTTHPRRVRRYGPDSCRNSMRRTLRRWWGQVYDELTGQRQIRQFQDYERHKREILEGITEKPYSVEDLYYETGCFVTVATSTWFQTLTYLVIFLSAIWISVDTAYYNDPSFETTRRVMENIFCTFFTLELGIRFGAFTVKIACLTDRWFVFDLILCVFMIGETWLFPVIIWMSGNEVTQENSNVDIIRLLRSLKLVRLGRFARLMAAFPELMTLVKGIFHAIRSVFFTAVLLFILLYIFGIFFTTHAQSSNSEELMGYFGTLKGSMWILLMAGVFVDGPKDILDNVKGESPVLTATFVVFISISSLTVLNMLIGILCTVVDRVYQREKEDGKVNSLKAQMLEMLEVHSEDGNHTLRKTEFDTLLRNPEVNLILARFDVDASDLKALKDGLYADKYALAGLLGAQTISGESTNQTSPPEDSMEAAATMAPHQTNGDNCVLLKPEEVELTFNEFLTIILRLRGGNTAKVNDIVELREYMKKLLDRNYTATSGSAPRYSEGGLNPMHSSREVGQGRRFGSLAEEEEEAPKPEKPSFPEGQRVHSLRNCAWEARSFDQDEASGKPFAPVPPSEDPHQSQMAAPLVDAQSSQLLEIMDKLATGQQQLLARQQELESRQAAWQKEFMEQQTRLNEQVSTLCTRFQAMNPEADPKAADTPDVWC